MQIRGVIEQIVSTLIHIRLSGVSFRRVALRLIPAATRQASPRRMRSNRSCSTRTNMDEVEHDGELDGEPACAGSSVGWRCRRPRRPNSCGVRDLVVRLPRTPLREPPRALWLGSPIVLGARPFVFLSLVAWCQHTNHVFWLAHEGLHRINGRDRSAFGSASLPWSAACLVRFPTFDSSRLHHPPPSLANCGTAETDGIFRTVGGVLQG